MKARIKYRQAIENTLYVASLCKCFSLPIGKLHPPSIEGHQKALEKLGKLCFKELASLYSPAGIGYLRRLDQELLSRKQNPTCGFFSYGQECSRLRQKSKYPPQR